MLLRQAVYATRNTQSRYRLYVHPSIQNTTQQASSSIVTIRSIQWDLDTNHSTIACTRTHVLKVPVLGSNVGVFLAVVGWHIKDTFWDYNVTVGSFLFSDWQSVSWHSNTSCLFLHLCLSAQIVKCPSKFSSFYVNSSHCMHLPVTAMGHRHFQLSR